jgi:hypothetical protein
MPNELRNDALPPKYFDKPQCRNETIGQSAIPMNMPTRIAENIRKSIFSNLFPSLKCQKPVNAIAIPDNVYRNNA